MIFSKTGFDSIATTNTVTTSDNSSVPKSYEDWVVTINDAMATINSASTSIRMTSKTRPAMFIWDEFPFISEATVSTWRDREVEPTVVDRKELHAALQEEQMETCSFGEVEDCDWDNAACCDEEEDCTELSVMQSRLEAMESMLSVLVPQFNTMECRMSALDQDLRHERNLRYTAECRVQMLEGKIQAADARLNAIESDSTVMKSRVFGLQLDTTTTRAKVEQLESLTAPTKLTQLENQIKNNWEVTFEHPPKSLVPAEIVDSMRDSSWELKSGDQVIRGAKPAKSIDLSNIKYNNGDCSIVLAKSRLTVGSVSVSPTNSPTIGHRSFSRE